MRTCAWAESTCACAVSKPCWASSNLARVVQPFFNSSCCRPKARRAWVSCASADERLACAERSAFCWFWGSSRATTWPAVTTSPTLTGRSIMRPSSRKARLTWSLARIWPVSETVSPSARCSTVTVRTGRAWEAGGGRLVAARDASRRSRPLLGSETWTLAFPFAGRLPSVPAGCAGKSEVA